MENQAYHIQVLLVDELDNCKGKGNEYAKAHINKIQEAYKQDDFELKKPTTKDKEQIQEEVLLYKSYNMSYASPPIQKLHPCGYIVFQLYKPAFLTTCLMVVL